MERLEPARAQKPAKPVFDVAELTERIASVQHSNMDQLSGEIAVLKKYLKSKRVPEEATDELDSLCQQHKEAWTNAVGKIRTLLEE